MVWWKKYEAVIVGQESGNVTPLSFVRFWTERQAVRWTTQMNRAHNGRHENPLTKFDYRRRTG